MSNNEHPITPPGRPGAVARFLVKATSMAEPLPCPFCGHIGISIVQTDTHKWRTAQCNECGAQSGDVRWIYTEDDPDAQAAARALEAWNTRHPSTSGGDFDNDSH